jgi:hypothetical protein
MVCCQCLHEDLGIAGFGSSEGEVVGCPLRTPFASTLLEEFHCIHLKFSSVSSRDGATVTNLIASVQEIALLLDFLDASPID